MKRLLLILILVAISFAQSPLPPSNTTILPYPTKIMQGCDASPPDLYSTFSLSYLAIIIIALLYTLAYMAGKTFHYEITEATLRIKIDEIFTTLVVLIAITMAYEFVNAGGGYYYLDQAMEYNHVVLVHIGKLLGTLSIYTTIVNIFYGLSISIPIIPGVPIITFTFTFGPAIKPLINAIVHSSNFLTFVVMEWITRGFMLCLIKKWWLTFLLPFGVVLRSFSITKDAGNTLIALAVGLYFFYPIMLTMNYDIYELSYGKLDVEKLPIINMFNLYFGSLKKLDPGSIITIIISFMLGVILKGGYTVAIIVVLLAYWLVKALIDVTFILLVLSIFLPALNIFLTLTFIMELGKMLGTDINISAFTRLI